MYELYQKVVVYANNKLYKVGLKPPSDSGKKPPRVTVRSLARTYYPVHGWLKRLNAPVVYVDDLFGDIVAENDAQLENPDIRSPHLYDEWLCDDDNYRMLSNKIGMIYQPLDGPGGEIKENQLLTNLYNIDHFHADDVIVFVDPEQMRTRNTCGKDEYDMFYERVTYICESLYKVYWEQRRADNPKVVPPDPDETETRHYPAEVEYVTSPSTSYTIKNGDEIVCAVDGLLYSGGDDAGDVVKTKDDAYTVRTVPGAFIVYDEDSARVSVFPSDPLTAKGKSS